MAALYSFKISGRTSASADGTATGIIATAAVTLDDNGRVTFTDSTGRTRHLQIANDESAVSALLQVLFTGVGGVDAGSAGVQGYRFFGQPVVPQ